jgi:hypothetical protein
MWWRAEFAAKMSLMSHTSDAEELEATYSNNAAHSHPASARAPLPTTHETPLDTKPDTAAHAAELARAQVGGNKEQEHNVAPLVVAQSVVIAEAASNSASANLGEAAEQPQLAARPALVVDSRSDVPASGASDDPNANTTGDCTTEAPAEPQEREMPDEAGVVQEVPAPQPRGGEKRSSVVKFSAPGDYDADNNDEDEAGGGTRAARTSTLRSIRSNMSVSMGNRNRAAVSDDEAERIVALMDAADGGGGSGGNDEGYGAEGEDDYAPQQPSLESVATCGAEPPPATGDAHVAAPDPMLAWKAEALRALRGTADGAMTVGALAALAPNPEPGSSYAAHLQTHLIDRLLARWVVEGESIQLCSIA